MSSCITRADGKWVWASLKKAYARQGKPSDILRQSEYNQASAADGEEKDEEVSVCRTRPCHQCPIALVLSPNLDLRMPDDDEDVAPMPDCSGSVSKSRPLPKLSGTPRQLEDNKASTADGAKPDITLSVFIQIVNQYVGADNDAKYTDAPVRARKNAVEAERRAKEMEDALSWLKSPEAAAKAAAEWAPLFGAARTMVVSSARTPSSRRAIMNLT